MINMKTLEEYKEKCPSQWKNGTGHRILMALYFEDKESKGLKIDKLRKLTELPDSIFNNSIGFLTKTQEVRFNETTNRRIYFLEDKLRHAFTSIYDSL